MAEFWSMLKQEETEVIDARADMRQVRFCTSPKPRSERAVICGFAQLSKLANSTFVFFEAA